jgi:hypothetical protein
MVEGFVQVKRKLGDDEDYSCVEPCEKDCGEDCECFNTCFGEVASQCTADVAADVEEWIAGGCSKDDDVTGPPPADEVREQCNNDAANGGQTAGFDWGAGCASGNGCFTLDLSEVEDYKDVGVIPAGKFDVEVHLDAETDIDITLFDMDYSREFPEGKAVVAWCGSPRCNAGVLGMAAGPEAGVYERPGINPINIEYSGYNGDQRGGLGKEYIRISGEVSTPLIMKAFSYATGSAKVTYRWGESQSACCLGTGPCGGSFKQPVAQNNILDVGEIPKGKRDIQITLSSPKDVDVQLYDMEDKGKFSEGKAIIAWCGSPKCNLGVMNGPGQQSTFYPDAVARNQQALYSWSGYNGENGQPGRETIAISGTTTRTLMMKVFGYDSGEAEVSYTYWNDPPSRVARAFGGA